MSDPKGVMFQFFEWNLPGDGTLWNTIAENAAALHGKGVTAVWFPPPTKGQGGNDVGYGIYDLYDLGEFDQKGSVRTKYGTKDELLRAVAAVQAAGMDAYLDCVMNHRLGGDETEDVEIVEVNPENRLEVVSDPYVIKAWSRFTCPGRGNAHSDFQWTKDQFDAFGADANQPDVGGKIFRRVDRVFSADVSPEKGNFDYLLGADVDSEQPDVKEELVRWGTWLLLTTGARGIRLDAAKHVSTSFAKEWLARVRATVNDREVFAVAEYWSGDHAAIDGYLQAMEGTARVFDVPLHYRMHEAGEKGRDFDIRTLFDDTVVAKTPVSAVTFVDNHDSQPGQSLTSPVADWFKPIAYAFILLRSEGYPCVFYGDYFGNDSDGDERLVAHRVVIDAMLAARAKFLYGERTDYGASSTCVGWLTSGDEEHPGVMAVVVSTADEQAITMQTRPGLEFEDITGAHVSVLAANEEGFVDFPARGGSVSVWCSR